MIGGLPNIGRIRALRYKRTDTGAEFVAVDELYASSFRGRSDGITSFGVDENDELYILTLGAESVIHRLMICDKEPGEMPSVVLVVTPSEITAAIVLNNITVPWNIRTNGRTTRCGRLDEKHRQYLATGRKQHSIRDGQIGENVTLIPWKPNRGRDPRLGRDTLHVIKRWPLPNHKSVDISPH